MAIHWTIVHSKTYIIKHSLITNKSSYTAVQNQDSYVHNYVKVQSSVK